MSKFLGFSFVGSHRGTLVGTLKTCFLRLLRRFPLSFELSLAAPFNLISGFISKICSEKKKKNLCTNISESCEI